MNDAERDSNAPGSRFKRALSPDELEHVLAAGRTVDDKHPADKVFKGLWDLIFQEAEGVTWNEAEERCLKFHPSNYAIPKGQADQIRAAMAPADDRADQDLVPALLWFNLGPSEYDDSEETHDDLPTAALIKRANRRKPGKPSAARIRRVQERLLDSPFTEGDYLTCGRPRHTFRASTQEELG